MDPISHESFPDGFKWLDIRPENDAEWLVLARKKLNLQQLELSYIIHVDSSLISRIENGHIKCPERLRKAVIALLENQKAARLAERTA